MRCEYRFVLFF